MNTDFADCQHILSHFHLLNILQLKVTIVTVVLKGVAVPAAGERWVKEKF